MSRLDEIAPNFRRAARRWPEANLLAAHHRDLAIAVDGNAIGVIDLAKSFLESVCRTILKDAGKSIDANPTSQVLLSSALDEVGLRNSKGVDRLFDKLLGAYNTVATTLFAVRNDESSTAHGKDGFLDELSGHHHRIYVLSVDSVLALMLGALERSVPELRHTRLPYDHFETLHRKIDEAVDCRADVEEGGGDEPGQVVVLTFIVPGIDAMDLRYPPSKLLFELDRDAYIDFLQAAENARLIQEDQE